uniref:Photosystem II reaction center protein X n=1 Tax=Toxarium undulatum TaxID=210620 RepID=A0A1D8DB45_9STRA|nr:photosystem II protein X [Toxarium undulatum]AOS86589.1 photosystem II protein X [Toxarium undulatum]
MNNSLFNFISSLVAGGLVIAILSVALIIISKSDRVIRS